MSRAVVNDHFAFDAPFDELFGGSSVPSGSPDWAKHDPGRVSGFAQSVPP